MTIRQIALRCAHESAGYAVPVEPGTELEVIRARFEELERHCRSYARSVSALHRRLDERVIHHPPAPVNRWRRTPDIGL